MEEAAFAITGRRMPVVVKPLAPAEAEIGFVWGNQSGGVCGVSASRGLDEGLLL